jgi:hypothetical protein
MIHPLRMHYDKLLLAVAITGLGCNIGWVHRQQAGLRSLRAEAANPSIPMALYVPALQKAPAASASVWTKPRSQSRGEGWRYEVFTPPVIHYLASTRVFALAPTEPARGAADPGLSAWGLLAVKREPYRLQLAGYFGAPDDYLVAFASPRSAEIFLARAGHRFANLELTFKSFEVRKMLVTEAEFGPVHEVAALAVLLDEQSGREVVLDSRKQRFADGAIAVFQQPDDTERRRELREGDTFAEAGSLCRIERIQLEPAEVIVSRTTPGMPAPELLVLRPMAQAAASTTNPEAMPRIGAGRVASNDP